MYYFYTDGATSHNGADDAKGGWAWVLARFEGLDIIVMDSRAEAEDNTTNNRCELLAVINACQYAVQNEMLPARIYTDSAYIHNCMRDAWYKRWESNGWINSKKEPVKNRDLWEQLIPFFKRDDFEFLKVKGHSTNKANNLADAMAVEARGGN